MHFILSTKHVWIQAFLQFTLSTTGNIAFSFFDKVPNSILCFIFSLQFAEKKIENSSKRITKFEREKKGDAVIFFVIQILFILFAYF